MSYLILALGALLSLGGALALHASYGIVQVERGWAGVIAGSTALSCGIMTIALGLILHRLTSFYALLKAGTGVAQLPRGLDEHEIGGQHADQAASFDGGITTVPEAGPLTPVAGLRTWPQRQARSSLSPGRSMLKSRGLAVPAALRAREPDHASQKASMNLPGSSRSEEAMPDLPAEPGPGLEFPIETTKEPGHELELGQSSTPMEETLAAAAQSVVREPSLSEGDIGSEPPIDAPFPEMPIALGESGIQSEPDIGWPAESASIEAILPEEFRLAPDNAHEARKADSEEHLPEAPAAEHLKAAQPVGSESGAVAHHLESASLEDPPAPVIQGGTLAIVGRYESEGTSYVMYADGSIEARTEHAVFHFKSMAELKNYMDSQAQNSRG
ncbi:MAG: hypothetical protein L0Y50_01580 [Beijerinckiaceae bacterium]|nr:hypothetical protein [Beijerinckiaceae bacterium]MCI0734962.1 hypothetical protein [Beijerinckiaceae bacterium]